MRILFDHQVFSWQGYGGISRYIVEQMRWLPTFGETVLLPEGFYSENVYLKHFPEYQRHSLGNFSFKGKKYLQNILGRRHSLHALQHWKPDVFHPTYFDTYYLKTLRKHGIPFVVTVHDMIHELYRHGQAGLFSLDRHVVDNKALLCREADAVIAVSENTKNDMIRLYPWLDPAKIHVIHHGSDFKPANGIATARPYLLFVGQRKGYKNFAWMLRQLAPLLRSRSQDLELWCVGGAPFDAAELAEMDQLGITRQVIYQRVGSDAELAAIYASAECFIFPSQYEGFGIPVLEAFSCGCPAVLNRKSALPEAGGEAAMYFDETQDGSLPTAVNALLEDRSLRAAYIAKGKERVQHFTWERSARAHLTVYQQVVHG